MSHNPIDEIDLHKLSKIEFFGYCMIGALSAYVSLSLLNASQYVIDYWIALVILAVILRPRLLSGLVGKDFTFALRVQRTMIWMTRGAIIVTYVLIIPIVIIGRADWFALPAIILSFSFCYSYILDSWRQGRLSLYEFIHERDNSEKCYTWLRQGLEIVAERLKTLGIAIPPERLLLGMSYGIIRGEQVDAYCTAIAEWVGQPERGSRTHQAFHIGISRVLEWAKDSEAEGIIPEHTTLTMRDRFLLFPWETIFYFLAVVFLIAEAVTGRLIPLR